MKSKARGKNTLAVEVSNISAHGFWVLIGEREHFVGFKQNPWFKDATVAQILNVQIHHSHHLNWPDLDIDLELESLVQPGKYPLVYR